MQINLNWGNDLIFGSEEEYYETLGFLCKTEEYIRVYVESNDKSGAWAAQGRMALRNISIDSLPEPLKNAFEESADGRISETKFVNNLRANHCFTKIVDPTGNNYTQRLYMQSLEDVLATIPEEYENDFYRGYHWNCEVIERIRSAARYEINWAEETELQIDQGQSEGRKAVYYTTKYERSARNRVAAIRIHGAKCMICGFDFENTYGELGKGYIEVHHIKPLSELDEEVVVNPETDLVCVCANCHRMLHRFKDYIVTPDELMQIVADNKL